MPVQNRRNRRQGLRRICVGWMVGVGHPWYGKINSRRMLRWQSLPPPQARGRAKRGKHQFSSATVMVDERELSCTFWRMMSRSGLAKGQVAVGVPPR